MAEEKKCFICGATKNLVRTECCGKWICDDEDEYVPFSHARNSCHRNHRRFTLCAYHHDNGHKGDWKTCEVACVETCGTNAVEDIGMSDGQNKGREDKQHPRCWLEGKVRKTDQGRDEGVQVLPQKQEPH